MLTSQGHYGKKWKLMLSSESACFRTKAHPRETANCAFNWLSGFPSNMNLCVPASRFMLTRFAIFMINICIYNHPFNNFMNREYEGVEDLVCGNVGKTD